MDSFTRRAEGRVDDPLLRDDARQELVGGHVEGGIIDPHPLRGRLDPGKVGDLLGGALLDDDVLPVRDGEVDGGGGQHRIEGDTVVLGQHRHGVGADLVGKVPVGRHAVAPQKDQVHEAGGHAVGDEGGGDAVPHQLPGGEPGPLEEGPCLVAVDHGHMSGGVGRAHHPQGGAIAPGGDGPGVAVGEDAGPLGHQGGPVLSHLPVHGDVLPVDGLGLPDEGGDGLGVPALGLQHPPHPVQGPEEVHRRGTAGRQGLQGGLQPRPEVPGPVLMLQSGQAHGVGRRDADGRRPPDHQAADGLRHGAVIGIVVPDLLHRESGLVQQGKGGPLPANGVHMRRLLSVLSADDCTTVRLRRQSPEAEVREKRYTQEKHP